MRRASVSRPWRSSPSLSPEQIQENFYTETASDYDETMVRRDDEHYVALHHISVFISGLGAKSVLDVGAGTGRGVKYLQDHHLDIEVRGVEPVEALIAQAERHGGIPAGSIIQARGESLPFDDESFDVVCELGVLHHVPDPAHVVEEMMRVGRCAIFISDENRFGRGRHSMRLVKFALHRLGLWKWVYRLAHRGRAYHQSADGGVAYSYSVYESLPALNEWADRVFLIPTVPAGSTWFHPLFGATHLLLCAIRDLPISEYQ